MKVGECKECGAKCVWMPIDGDLYEEEFCSWNCKERHKTPKYEHDVSSFSSGEFYWCDDLVGQYSDTMGSGFWMCGDDEIYPASSFKNIVRIMRNE